MASAMGFHEIAAIKISTTSQMPAPGLDTGGFHNVRSKAGGTVGR